MGLLTGNGSLLQSITNPTQWWDYFKNGRTNEVNENIANNNLEYQRERNAIEDARYEDETNYNRAFAEDEREYQRAFAENEREYNRALQQQLFEREDTAFSRQAADMASIGINPLSQQLSGAGAGQVVGGTSSGSSVEPGLSSRGGSALHNDFKMQDVGVLQALSPLATLANTINQVATGQGQRDLIQAQVDKQNLDNYITAMTNGIYPRWYKDFTKFQENKIDMPGFFGRENNRFNDERINRNREIAVQEGNLKLKEKPEWARNMDYLLSDDFLQSAEKALTKGSNLFDKAFNQSTNDKGLLKGLGSLKFNPFSWFMSLFF